MVILKSSGFNGTAMVLNVKNQRKFGKIRVSVFPIVPLHRITLFGPFILNGGSMRTSKENVFINLRENIQ